MAEIGLCVTPGEDVEIVDDAIVAEGQVAGKGIMVMTDNGANGTFLQSESGNLKSVVLSRARTAVITHRSAVVAVDKIIVPTLATLADQPGQDGLLTAVPHGAAVATGNAQGSAGASNILTATPTVDKSLDLTVPQVVGAAYYDIFCSTSTTDPLWVGRITEAQRALGCSITAVGVIGAAGPGGVGIVNIQVVGTGLACTNAIFTFNNAYIISAATPIVCTGYNKLLATVSLAITDLRDAPSLTVIPFYSNDGATWYAGPVLALGIMTATGKPLGQQFVLDVYGVANVVFLVDAIAGEGLSATIKTQMV